MFDFIRSVEKFGEKSIAAAFAYFEYGRALLAKEEENPSTSLLSNVGKGEDSKGGDDGEQKDSEQREDGDEDEDGENEKNDDDDNDDEEDQEVGDLQIAWEVFEVPHLFLCFQRSFSYSRLIVVCDHRCQGLCCWRLRNVRAINFYWLM